MKVLQINIFGNLSTGKIACQLAREYEANGDTCYVAYARGTVPNDIKSYKIGNKFDVYSHALMARINDSCGFHSKKATKKFIKWIKEYNPDLIHLHNIHGYYINIKMLFDYLNKSNKRVYWTLHDCWAFTGHCCYFDYVKCDKWKSGCKKCPQKKSYPKSYFDNSAVNYANKKRIFTLLSPEKLEIITPSNWLANLVRESYLNKYKVSVIRNKINLDIFKPTISDFREKNKLTDKKIILGVASTWDKRKGLDEFIKLAKHLDKNKYKIIIVGLTKKQCKYINSKTNIMGMTRTKNQKELVDIYSAADLFFNPTLEENYPTVNLEAQACGTKVFTFDTGGCRETNIGNLEVVNENNYLEKIYEEII